jgi:hypothetical protein
MEEGEAREVREGLGDKGKGRQGEGETRGRGDKGKRRQGERAIRGRGDQKMPGYGDGRTGKRR